LAILGDFSHTLVSLILVKNPDFWANLVVIVFVKKSQILHFLIDFFKLFQGFGLSCQPVASEHNLSYE
jgi:hypothetical protein